MPLKLDAVLVPASFRKRHERKGGAELDMYSVARATAFCVSQSAGSGQQEGRARHAYLRALRADQPARRTPTRRPSDKELREVRAHFSDLGTLEEDNSASDAGGFVRHLWGEGK